MDAAQKVALSPTNQLIRKPSQRSDAVTSTSLSAFTGYPWALAVAGYYSYNCNNTGSGNRNYFQIQGNDGVIDVVSTC